MNYTDIKDQVVEVTDNLELIPITVLEDIIDRVGLYNATDLLIESPHYEDYRGRGTLRHPSINLVIHAKAGTNSLVATVMVQDVPAFYFIVPSKGFTTHYVLNTSAIKNFVHYLLELRISTQLEGYYESETPWTQDVPELAEFSMRHT